MSAQAALKCDNPDCKKEDVTELPFSQNYKNFCSIKCCQAVRNKDLQKEKAEKANRDETHSRFNNFSGGGGYAF